MSHPFTLEYMMEGEMSSTEVDGDGTKLQEIQQESKADTKSDQVETEHENVRE